MPPTTAALALALAATLPFAWAQTLANETVLGVYMFHRHGDRTAKATPPTNLTFLGYQEVFTSGQYYRSRYIAVDAPYRINGVNADLVLQSQIAISAPDDTVLQNSATGFLQGLYPPVGSGLDVERLANGTNITAPMQGYQLIPVELVSSGTGSEDTGFLQSTSNCAAATIDSNEYFSSAEYMALLKSTQAFYDGLAPVINSTFNSSQTSFKNAYTIFDYINVAEIHNSSIPAEQLLTNATLFQVRTLADAHEWNLAFNASSPTDMRAIAGKTLAAQVVQFLNGTLTGAGAQKIAVQFGAYGSFASFFGLANVYEGHPDLMGVADYASAMSFELFTNTSTPVTSASYPAPDEVYVRFLFHNGTTSNISEPVPYPLFGSGQAEMRWADFTAGMGKFSIGSTEQWCTACGNFTGTCAAFAPAGAGGDSGSSTDGSAAGGGNGLSPAVNGVIGAMVTLAVVLGVEALIMLLGGWRVVRKGRSAGHGAGAVAGGGTAKA